MSRERGMPRRTWMDVVKLDLKNKYGLGKIEMEKQNSCS